MPCLLIGSASPARFAAASRDDGAQGQRPQAGAGGRPSSRWHVVGRGNGFLGALARGLEICFAQLLADESASPRAAARDARRCRMPRGALPAIGRRRSCDDGADGGDRIVALAPGELVKGVTGACGQGPGKWRLDDHLVGAARRRHVESKNSSAAMSRRPDGPAAATSRRSAAAPSASRPPHRHGRGCPPPCRDCGSVHARRCAIASRDQRIGLNAHVAASLELAMAGHRLDDDLPPSTAMPVSPATCWMSTRRRRDGEAEIHRGNKALAAGKHHRVGITGEGNYRFFSGSAAPDTGTAAASCFLRGPLPA